MAEPTNAKADSQKAQAAKADDSQAKSTPPAEIADDESDDSPAEIVIHLGAPDDTKDIKSADRKADDSKPDTKDQARLERLAQISREALSYRGTPYVWGGDGRVGFDCSGFTQYIFYKRGIKLPHSAKQQFNGGVAVQKSDLQEGDLVFFNTRGSISHVGMFIGNGQFVHAANPRRGVTVDALDSTYYGPRYAGARRYTK
jgi:cell wall-associated NlpC family hydrolase